MQENKIGGKFYRILIDEVNDIWDRISFWTKSTDVEFNDGSDLETKITSVNNSIQTVSNNCNGIISELTANNKRIYMDYQNGKYGYNTSANRGSSTFHPFSGGLAYAVELGTLGGTFDLKSYTNYKNFTTDKNFFVRITGVSYSGGEASWHAGYWEAWDATGGGGSSAINVGALLSYNSSTGILTTVSGGGGSAGGFVYGDHDIHEASSVGTSLGISGKVYLLE